MVIGTQYLPVYGCGIRWAFSVIVNVFHPQYWVKIQMEKDKVTPALAPKCQRLRIQLRISELLKGK